MSIAIAIYVHLRSFKSIYINSEAVSNPISGDFCHEGRGGRGVDSRYTMVKTNQKPITLKSMICWSRNVLASTFELSVHRIWYYIEI